MKEKIIEWIKSKKWYLVAAGAILILLVAVYITGCVDGLRCAK